MKKNKARVAVLVSGGGTNLQAIIDACGKGIITSGEVVLVISDTEGAYALTRAEKAGIRGITIPKKAYRKKMSAFEKELTAKLDEEKIDLIVLAGFLTILSAKFTKHFKDRIINVHPSLIPSFCGEGFYGLKVHEAALEKGVKVTGATVHFVNEIPDGGRIILQKAVAVKDGDTPEILQKRVMRLAEWKLLPAAVELVSREIVENRKQEKK
ncbi:MAG: phosphoribosylglycinamide formyltransferase [Eubacterium sp.]|nr:phosphoribosylglycinamide formyltransferase [Eubacterium sp.]